MAQVPSDSRGPPSGSEATHGMAPWALQPTQRSSVVPIPAGNVVLSETSSAGIERQCLGHKYGSRAPRPEPGSTFI